jgi:hypothetical protein
MQGGTLSNRTLRLHDTELLVRVCCPSAACGPTSAVPRFCRFRCWRGRCIYVPRSTPSCWIYLSVMCDTIARQTRCEFLSSVSCVSITGKPIHPPENHVFPRCMFAAQTRFQPRIHELAGQKWAFAMCQREEITEQLDRELSFNHLQIYTNTPAARPLFSRWINSSCSATVSLSILSRRRKASLLVPS